MVPRIVQSIARGRASMAHSTATETSCIDENEERGEEREVLDTKSSMDVLSEEAARWPGKNFNRQTDG